MLLAGCGQSRAVAPPPVHAAHIGPTAIPKTLVSYASSAADTLSQSTTAGSALLTQMQQDSPSSLRTACSDAGFTLSDLFTTFESIYQPATGRSIYAGATIGFRHALSAIDECGMAVDQNSRSQMKVAARDLSLGLHDLSTARAHVSTWSHVAK